MNDAENAQCIVAIGLAVSHLTDGGDPLPISTEVCFRNACAAYSRNETEGTLHWCLETLAHSVGQRHADYMAVRSMLPHCSNPRFCSDCNPED